MTSIFVFKTCHLYKYYVMLGFQMRYCKGHTFLCQSCFTIYLVLLMRSISFFQSHFKWDLWCPGVPEHHCPLVSSLVPSGRRKKKTIVSTNERKKKKMGLDDMLHAVLLI